MQREDKFVGLVDVGAKHLVAEFEHAYPIYVSDNNSTQWHIETHFRINLESLLTRMTNLNLPINYEKNPWMMVQENAALDAIIAVRPTLSAAMGK